MNDLTINYGISPLKKKTGLIVGIYLIIFCGYFFVSGIMAKTYDLLFYASTAGVLSSTFIILVNTVFSNEGAILINNSRLEFNTSENTQNTPIEWTDVSRVMIGAGYITFILNAGKRQQKVELSSLKYGDVFKVKSKIIELCEFKNIPYQND